MMRKLAVTAFVLSLAALGCGSDNGTSPKDTGVPDGANVKTDVGTNKDVAQGTEAGPEVQVDVAQGTEGGAKLDVAAAEVSLEAGGTVIDAPKDVQVKLDGGVDGTQTKADSGVDSQTQTGEAGSAVDTGTAVDGGAVDGSSID